MGGAAVTGRSLLGWMLWRLLGVGLGMCILLRWCGVLLVLCVLLRMCSTGLLRPGRSLVRRRLLDRALPPFLPRGSVVLHVRAGGRCLDGCRHRIRRELVPARAGSTGHGRHGSGHGGLRRCADGFGLRFSLVANAVVLACC